MVGIVNERLCYKFTIESQGGRIWKISRALCKILLSLEGVSCFVMLTLFIVKLVILLFSARLFCSADVLILVK